jgi:hypothetical protein
MKPNPVIGRCPCPVKGCEKAMAVKRVQPRTDNPARARKSGLLYGDCPDHGRFGFDGAPAMQDYITENSTKCDEGAPGTSAPAAPAPHPSPLPAATQPKVPARAPAPLKTAPASAPTPPKPAPLPSAPAISRGPLDW